jgi:hypothetical protein
MSPSDCTTVLTTLARGDSLDAAGARHCAACTECASAADALAAVAAGVGALPDVAPSPELDARVLRAAAPLLAANARAADALLAADAAPLLAADASATPLRTANARAVSAAGRAFALDGRRLARALLPAILLFPLLVVADVWLLRFVHETLAGFLPRAFSTWLVLSYAALLSALGCLVFGAIPLLVERQAPLLVWKEEHVGT